MGKSAEKLSPVSTFLWEGHSTRGYVIKLMQTAQAEYGYIPKKAIKDISAATGTPETDIYGIISFYKQFRLEKPGRHLVKVCDGTACHVSGSNMLIDQIEENFGILPGNTTEDDVFTLEAVACLGCCSLAPVVMIDGKVYGKLDASKVQRLMKRIHRRTLKEMKAEQESK